MIDIGLINLLTYVIVLFSLPSVYLQSVSCWLHVVHIGLEWAACHKLEFKC